MECTRTLNYRRLEAKVTLWVWNRTLQEIGPRLELAHPPHEWVFLHTSHECLSEYVDDGWEQGCGPGPQQCLPATAFPASSCLFTGASPSQPRVSGKLHLQVASHGRARLRALAVNGVLGTCGLSTGDPQAWKRLWDGAVLTCVPRPCAVPGHPVGAK